MTASTNVCGTNFVDFNFSNNSCPSTLFGILWANGKWEIPLYSIIFLLSVLGNVLVILTLGKNQRIKTVTNVFLLNLAASDLVLAVLCMPFTLVGTLLRDFIFGNWMCKLVPFLQATSVAASVWTLVALSVERYYAICHPLQSKKRQAPSHARRLIGWIWIGGVVSMLPITVLSELQPTENGRHKCRENWPSGEYERAYNLFLDLLLLVIPLVVLAATYYRIATILRKDLKRNPRVGSRDADNFKVGAYTGNSWDRNAELTAPGESDKNPAMGHPRDKLLSCKWPCAFITAESSFGRLKNAEKKRRISSEANKEPKNSFRMRKVQRATAGDTSAGNEIGLRRTNYERNLVRKQRAIKMLVAVVLEFFICWTPLYVINTLALFSPHTVYVTVGYKTISFCQLLAYASGCCNPITYCFMNKGFRTSFVNTFSCRNDKTNLK